MQILKQAVFIAAFASIAATSYAGKKDKPVDLTGSWKETARQNRGNEAVAYTDTTFYDFLIGNEYTTQRKNAYMYRGTYKVTPGQLDFGMRVYNIVEMSGDRMVLKDDGGKYEFRRWDKAASLAENNSAASNGTRAYKDKMENEKASPAQLSGRWDVYKRTSSTTLSAVDYGSIIRSVTFKAAGDAVSGGVYAANDMDGRPSWQVARYADGTLYCSGKSARELKVLRCTGTELILQEGTITYFFKQFK